MNTIPLWRQFIQEPRNIQEETKNGAILIMFSKTIRPKDVFSIIKDRNKPPTKEELEELGYVFAENGKLKRSGRFFWSREMEEISKWCSEKDIECSFDIKGQSCLTADGKLLQLMGPYNKEQWNGFPVEYKYIQAHKYSFTNESEKDNK